MDSKSNDSEAETILIFIWKAMKFYMMFIFATGVTVVFITAFFTWGEVLPFVAWFPRNIIFGYEVNFGINILNWYYNINL